MKKLLLAMAIGLAFAPAAFADDKVRAHLSGRQEVPYVSTPATGLLEAVINRDGTAIDWTLTYSGLEADSTQAHIHVGQRRVNGAVVVWLCKTAATPAGATTNICPPRAGTVSGTIFPSDVQTVTAQHFAPGELGEFIAAIRAGSAYANVHTTMSPSGEIRGQLRGRGRDDDQDEHHDRH